MRTSTIVMIAFAVVFGLLAVFIAQSWLNSQTEMRMKSLEANKKPIATSTVVVAGKPLRFGNELSSGTMREIPWPRRLNSGGRVRDHRRSHQGRSPHRAFADRGE